MKASEVLQRVLKWLGENSYLEAIGEIEEYGSLREDEGCQLEKDYYTNQILALVKQIELASGK